MSKAPFKPRSCYDAMKIMPTLLIYTEASRFSVNAATRMNLDGMPVL